MIPIKKAGIIPYIRTDRGVEMLFMVTSDAKFGGPDPMIGKGIIDPGESPEQAAIREGHEELGLKVSNFVSNPFLVKDSVIQGLCGDPYAMRILAVEVKNKDDFDVPHYETERTVWLTGREYYEIGRKNQWEFVSKLLRWILFSKFS